MTQIATRWRSLVTAFLNTFTSALLLLMIVTSPYWLLMNLVVIPIFTFMEAGPQYVGRCYRYYLTVSWRCIQLLAAIALMCAFLSMQ